jgi:hypothetical protein
VTLIRLRDRLGRLAAVVGGVELLSLAVIAVGAIAIAAPLIDALGQDAPDRDMEAMLQPRLRALTLLEAPVTLLSALLTALLFLSVRRNPGRLRQRGASDRRLEELLSKWPREGNDGLTREEQGFGQRASEHYQDRDR